VHDVRAIARRSITVLTLGCALAGAGAAHAQTLAMSPCSTQVRGDRSLCGTVAVPLDRSGQLPGTLALKVATIPPKRGPARGAVLVLAGGPGQAATPLIDDLPDLFGALLDTRQLITFDQRGTGGTALRCPSVEGSDPTITDNASAVAKCAAKLGPARTAYTTAASVADVDAVRAALGVEKLIVVGVSYGTKVALNYAQAFPQHVDRLVLDSVVPPDGNDPFARSTFAEIPRVLRAMCLRGCAFTPDPAADLSRVVGALHRKPLSGRVIDRHGRGRHTTLDAVDVLSLLLIGDGDPLERAAFPSALRSARLGDPVPLLRLAADVGGSEGEIDPREISPALFVATTCADGLVPWPAGTPIGARTQATTAALAALPARTFAPFTAGDARETEPIELCQQWPESPVAQEFGPLPSLPTLIVSGTEDLRTPRSDALALAARIPGSQVVTVPDTGHSALISDATGCASRAMHAFIVGRPVRRCARPATHRLANVPLAPPRLGAVRGLRGLPTDVGRTLHAVELTMAQLESHTFQGYVQYLVTLDSRVMSFGGLRAGYAHMGVSLYDVHRYTYIPGVAISFRSTADAKRLNVTVGGDDAVHGALRVTGDRIEGVLGGRRVSLRFHTDLVGASRGARAASLRDRIAVPRGWLR
jgi:pimeloyl-ACP methyl ester carboxylesterase